MFIRAARRTGVDVSFIYLRGQEVRVCEIYASHDTYQRERKKGWSEADYQEARNWFDEWEGSGQLEMALQP